jgi:hypothetical protein
MQKYIQQSLPMQIDWLHLFVQLYDVIVGGAKTFSQLNHQNSKVFPIEFDASEWYWKQGCNVN